MLWHALTIIMRLFIANICFFAPEGNNPSTMFFVVSIDQLKDGCPESGKRACRCESVDLVYSDAVCAKGKVVRIRSMRRWKKMWRDLKMREDLHVRMFEEQAHVGKWKVMVEGTTPAPAAGHRPNNLSPAHNRTKNTEHPRKFKIAPKKLGVLKWDSSGSKAITNCKPYFLNDRQTM